MMKSYKVGIIGGGAMGGALAEGLLLKNLFDPSDIIISNPHTDKLSHLSAHGVKVTQSNIEVAQSSELLVIAVKPWKVKEVVEEINNFLNGYVKEIAFIVAGIAGQELLSILPEGTTASIVMPNTALSTCQSMTFIVPLYGCPERALEVFGNLGETLTIEEHLLPAATALASCGIAYAMRYVRAATEGGVELGFKAKDAQEIIVQTLEGAISLLKRPQSHPETEIDKVTTPGGITIKGLNTMEKYGFSTAVIEGLKASRK